MPRPEKWFDEFITELRKKGFDPDAPGSADHIHKFTPPAPGVQPSPKDISYAFGGKDFNPETPLSGLSDAEKDELYALYSDGSMYINLSDIDPFSYITPVTDLFANFNTFETVDEAEQVYKDEITGDNATKFKASLQPEKSKGLDTCCKTLTDQFKDAKLEELAKTGLIRGKDGEMLNISRGERPFDKYTVLMDAFNAEQGVYIQDLDNKKTVQVKRQENGTIRKTPRDQLLVSKKLKDETMKQLMALATHIKNVRTENKQFKAIQEGIDDTLGTLRSTIHQDDFKRTLADFADKADLYYMGKVGAKMNRKGMTCLDIASQIRNIRDSVEKDVVPSEDKKGEFLSLKEVLAGKYVRAYAETMAKHSTNPKTKEFAEQLKSNPKQFNEAVDKTMNSKTFAALYGNPKDPEAVKRLHDGITMKPSQLFKTVQNEVKHPTAERIAHQNIMNQKHQSVTQNMQRGPVSPDLKADIAGVVAQMKGELQKIGNFGKNSPEYEKLMDTLTIADIRFKNGNNFMDVRKQMEEVALAAEAYQNSHIGKTMSARTAGRTAVCEKLISTFKAMDKNQKPSEVMPSDIEVKKTILAKNIVEGSAKIMLDSNNEKMQERGRILQTNTAKRDKQVEKIMNSKAFKDILGDDPKKIDKAMKDEPEKWLNTIASTQKKAHSHGEVMLENGEMIMPKAEKEKMQKEQEAPMIL